MSDWRRQHAVLLAEWEREHGPAPRGQAWLLDMDDAGAVTGGKLVNLSGFSIPVPPAPATDWLQLADITLHSGRRSSFKIECDGLTAGEVAAICTLLAKVVAPFGSVHGVPTGGRRLEEAMRPFATDGPPLFIDDVWTTGGSLIAFHEATFPEHGMQNCDCGFAVLFARGHALPYVTALFTLDDRLWDA